MKTWKCFLLTSFGILFGSGRNSIAIAQNSGRTLIASSGTSQVQLVELYTSESCSSCPPADQWISDLKSKPDLWKGFVPIVFHVDYWNYLDWKDEFSTAAMTKRQIDVAQLWPNPRVYTPGLVVDGKEWRHWQTSTNHQLPIPRKTQGISLKLFREKEGEFSIEIEGQKRDQNYIVHVAQLGMGLSTNVTSGENSGKLLRHNFVTLDWQKKLVDKLKSSEDSDKKISGNGVASNNTPRYNISLAKITGTGSGSGINDNIPNSKIQKVGNFIFAKPKQKISREAIAVWIEEAGNTTPLQALGSYL